MINCNHPFKQALTAIAIFCGLSVPAMSFARSSDFLVSESPMVSAKIAEAKMTLRDLYVDHIFWAREAVLGLVDKEELVVQTADLMAQENIKSLGAFGETYCGAEKAKQFMALFTEHYMNVIAYAKAAEATNVSAAEAAEKALYANSESLANFVSTENEFIKKEEFLGAFNTHIKQHTEQIKLIKGNDYAGESKLWLEMKKHAYMMADYMVEAMAKKYPDKF